MKILVVGASGTIGRAVAAHFSDKHEIVRAGRTSGDVHIDISNTRSIDEAFSRIGLVDAVVCAAGEAKWGPFDHLSEDDYYVGIKSKLMGQVNLVRIASRYLNPGGSLTLTTGVLGDDPVERSAGAALVNGAVNSFVKAVALELTGDRRINAVSPGLTQENAVKHGPLFPGHVPVQMIKVVAAYARSIEGKGTGQVITVYED